MGKIPSNSFHGNGSLPPSYVESVRQNCSITSLPEDQIKAFASNIVNATAASAALSRNLSTVESNLQALQNRFGKSEGIVFILKDKKIKLCIQMPEKNVSLPIDTVEIEDTINLSLKLPSTLQSQGVILVYL